MRYRKKKQYTLLLIVFIGLLGVGFALLSQNLTINGISTLKANEWDIHFDNVQINSNSVLLQPTDKAASIDTNDNTLVEYRVTLSTPGDFYEFTVDAVNAGTIDGMIGEVISQLNDSPISSENPLPSYLNYSVTYSDGVEIAPNHLLEAGATETYKVRIEFKKDIDESTLPATDQSNTFSFGVDYVQRESSAIAVPHPETIYTMNIGDWEDENNTFIKIGQAIPNTITQYRTITDVKNALNSYAGGTVIIPIYLKHIVSNGIVTDSYVEFEISEDFANNTPGMTAGVYAIQGAGGNCTYDEVNDEYLCEQVSPYYQHNKEVLLSAFGNSNCQEESLDESGLSYECHFDGIYVSIDTDGSTAIFNAEAVPEFGTYFCSFDIYRETSACSGIPDAILPSVYTANRGNRVNIGSAIPNDIVQYNSLDDARSVLTAANGGTSVPFALKHLLRNGIVKKSYIEFVVTDEMANTYPEMTVGVYELEYGSTNRMTLETAFGSSNCEFGNNYSRCTVDSFHIFSPNNYEISLDIDSIICYLYSNSSYCAFYDHSM